MIIGIGVDIVDVGRMERVIFRWQDKFLRRVFTDDEIRYCNNKKDPAQRFATRFAAKAALIKALFAKGEWPSYLEIEVGREKSRPAVTLSGSAKKVAKEMKVENIHLMVSHDGNYGVANVVLEG